MRAKPSALPAKSEAGEKTQNYEARHGVTVIFGRLNPLRGRKITGFSAHIEAK